MSLDNLDFEAARVVIERIAHIAETFAAQAGVGGMETAGAMISYLAEHPRDIEPCLRFGLFELPADWIKHGRLSWHAQKGGEVVDPTYARRAATIAALERDAA